MRLHATHLFDYRPMTMDDATPDIIEQVYLPHRPPRTGISLAAHVVHHYNKRLATFIHRAKYHASIEYDVLRFKNAFGPEMNQVFARKLARAERLLREAQDRLRLLNIGPFGHPYLTVDVSREAFSEHLTRKRTYARYLKRELAEAYAQPNDDRWFLPGMNAVHPNNTLFYLPLTKHIDDAVAAYAGDCQRDAFWHVMRYETVLTGACQFMDTLVDIERAVEQKKQETREKARQRRRAQP